MTAPEKPQALTIDEALMDASLWPRQHLAVDVKLEFRENGLFAWADLYGIPERPVSLTYVPLTPEGAESTTPTQLVAQLLSQALGRPVVERDDTAELVELLARMTYTVRSLYQNAPPAGDDAEVLALITAAEAALREAGASIPPTVES